ncbi:hypothetical protein [uncultured Methylobacterium sp.]|jgi:hypothetical protein|uniref:hypothetical protein n=1 Tax=uncultured Methylobacterium sp. TaxID=157278 RepID=UPI0026386E19|nr:hypothetical protein [uncultured Methylobacterium sp.]
MTLRQRFDFANELRAYAREVDALLLASRRDPERPIIDKAELADRMRARAAEVMRHDDPTERGVFRADLVFPARGGRAIRVETRAARRIRAGAR